MMIQESKHNIMERRAIPELLDKKYLIQAYQRGYRWEEKQVLDLLNDLLSYFSGDTLGQFYCLQPIVVKQIDYEGEKWYEVIDGQQRLATLRLIMQVFDQLNKPAFGPVINHSYVIRYATRPEMQNIFDSITVVNDEQNEAVIDHSNNQWRGFVDSCYIYKAAEAILKWFMDDTSRINIYGQYFYNAINSPKSVQVVWYETVEDKDPHDIFNRMNSLKVGLSCSELIRSLFLSSGTNFDLGDVSSLSQSLQNEILQERFNHKQTSINEKWDEIEQQMRDESFRAFLTRRKDTGRNAIELLFDLMSGKYTSYKFACPYPDLNKKDELYTYHYFKALFETDGEAWTTWERVLNAFEKIQYWYRERDLFHRIGFLNAIANDGQEDDVVFQLLSYSKGKRALQDEVKKLVKDSMTLPTVKGTNEPIDSLEKLSYDNKVHYEYMKKLLLLYNVETCCEQAGGEFFSFSRYRYKADGTTERKWTLEHIHAQNSDCLPKDNKNSWFEWIDCNLESLKKLRLGDPKSISAQNKVIEQLEYNLETPPGSDGPRCKQKKFTYDNIKDLFEVVYGFYDHLAVKDDRANPVHQLSNMTLLELEDNSMVGKSPFEVKRQEICEGIANDKYYPICTRKVFLKLYDQESMQVHSWSQKDRELYYEDMKKKLSKIIDESVF